MSLRKSLFWLVAVLVLASLACSQAGEILTPEEATERAAPTATPTVDPEQAFTYAVGAEIALQDPNGGFLVTFVNEPGGGSVTGQAPRGEIATISTQALVGEEEWYEITAPGGSGWITIGHIQTDE